MSTPNVRTLYKHILRGLESYPTKNRVSLIRSVKDEFRDNLKRTDKTDTLVKEAQINLRSIQQYSNLNKDKSSHWKIELEQNPMPGKE